jgi:hypothetical protein
MALQLVVGACMKRHDLFFWKRNDLLFWLSIIWFVGLCGVAGWIFFLLLP